MFALDPEVIVCLVLACLHFSGARTVTVRRSIHSDTTDTGRIRSDESNVCLRHS
jgi:hypothetical protein